MKKVTEVSPLERWGWVCPDCGDWIEEEDEPQNGDSLCCNGCWESFVYEEPK